MITFDGSVVTLDQLLAVARGGESVAVGATVHERLRAAREVVDRLVASDTPIYGLNSGLGANAGQLLDPTQRTLYQARAIQARSVGIGAQAPADRVRATLFVRLAGLAAGGSGISVPVFDALLAMLNNGVCPVIPTTGSIGVADLPQMSHAMLVLIGEGHAEFQGKRLTGAEALRRAGLAPAVLGPKDGLALISANAYTVGSAALALADVDRAMHMLDRAAVLSMEGFRANLSPLRPEALVARPAPGVEESAERVQALLAGSDLWREGVARRLQDPISFRCVPQIHGAVLWAFDQATAHVEAELNGAGDSPLVLLESGTLISTGNFHVPGLAIGMEALGLAMAQAASACVQRCLRLYSPSSSGLPLQLTRHGPAHSGFATMQKTLTALWNAIRHLANPACLDFFPLSEGAEDHAPMAPQVVDKTAQIADALVSLAAIELLSAAQAVDLSNVDIDIIGIGARRTYDDVRAHVPMLDEDRPLGPDVDRVRGLLLAGEFR
ncbi:HAL/PAL/TAL family ammonia-lyase [Variovorax sp. RHLX14]|uniref:HAL/PAL/TAL family ammonia-lyase n=1 Tax=Variovorax sp. RHLX14 TaxID=1259731 RepID=UPI003F449D1E